MTRSLFLVCLITGCATAQPDAALESTHWTLTWLQGKPVTPADWQREAHFVLHPDKRRVSGSGGCNGMGGSYDLDGDALRFRQLIRTMMACPKGMDTENAFVAALERVRTARVAGRRLELLDAQGRALAGFEAASR